MVDRLGAVEPSTMTTLGLGLGLTAAVAASLGSWFIALALFMISRIADGIDGELARAEASITDEGGYADIVADTAVFAAIPFGAAIGSDLDHIWPIAAALLGSFYLNTITWSYLAALFEKRAVPADSGGRTDGDGNGNGEDACTSVMMPTGLIEGSESIVFFAVMLALPRWLDWTMIAMAFLVVVGALMRFGNGHRQLAKAPGVAVQVHA